MYKIIISVVLAAVSVAVNVYGGNKKAILHFVSADNGYSLPKTYKPSYFRYFIECFREEFYKHKIDEIAETGLIGVVFHSKDLEPYAEVIIGSSDNLLCVCETEGHNFDNLKAIRKATRWMVAYIALHLHTTAHYWEDSESFFGVESMRPWRMNPWRRGKR